MPANARADLQFYFFLPESLSDNLWLASDARSFSVEAGDTAKQSDSTFDVDNDLWPKDPTPRGSTTSRSDQSERKLTSRDEHLLPQDDHDLQVDQPTDLRRTYRDDIISGTQYDYGSQRQLQLTEGDGRTSTWSLTDSTTNRLDTSTTLFPPTTESTTSPSDGERQRQINPPLTMHFADFVRQISHQFRTSTSVPPTTVSVRNGGRSRSGVTRPSLRQASMTTGSRRTLTNNSNRTCGRRKCPRFRPGIRRQFCQAHFGESQRLLDHSSENRLAVSQVADWSGTARNAENPKCIMQLGPECLTAWIYSYFIHHEW